MNQATATRSGDAQPDTRVRILHAAAELFADKGFHGASLREIADKVGIRTPSLFYHFKSKRELYEAVLAMMFELERNLVGMGLAMEGDFKQRAENLVRLYAYHLAENRSLATIVQREMLDNPQDMARAGREYTLPMLGMLTNFVRDGQAAGVFRPVDPLHFVVSVIGMTAFYYRAAPMLMKQPPARVYSAEGIEERVEHLLDVVRRSLFKD